MGYALQRHPEFISGSILQEDAETSSA